MKRTLLVFVFSLAIHFVNAQVITATVEFAQCFTHSLDYETHYAIEHDLLEYDSAVLTCTQYTFDLNKKQLIIEREGDPTFILDILTISPTTNILSVIAKYPKNNTKLDYLISEVPGENNYMLMCRYQQDGKLVGWFDREIELTRRF